MATAPLADGVLSSTLGKSNFQRVTRLLISGGTKQMRTIFDQFCPPSNLPAILKNPATKNQLKAAKLTKPQWDCLYPSPGVYGRSEDFDVTLLFRLLRTLCGLTPPATGWDALPTSTDHSLAADLARIKYFRNSVYGHVNQNMEITDDEFISLWQEISGALVRIAGQICPKKKKEWQDAIDKLLQDPLTTEDERNVEELVRWYENDRKVKKAMEELKVITKDGMDHLEMTIKNAQMELKGQSQVVGEKVRCLEKAVREEAQDIKDVLGGRLESTTQGVQWVEKAVREETQDIKDVLGGKLESTTQDVQCLGIAVREEAQDIKDVLGGRLESTTLGVQCLEKAVREETQDIKDVLGGKLESTTQDVQCLGIAVREEAQDIKDVLGGRLESTTQGVQCLEKAVREEAQDIKDVLGGKLESTTQDVQCLEKAVRGFGQILVQFIGCPSSSPGGPKPPTGGKIYRKCGLALFNCYNKAK